MRRWARLVTLLGLGAKRLWRRCGGVPAKALVVGDAGSTMRASSRARAVADNARNQAPNRRLMGGAGGAAGRDGAILGRIVQGAVVGCSWPLYAKPALPDVAAIVAAWAPPPWASPRDDVQIGRRQISDARSRARSRHLLAVGVFCLSLPLVLVSSDPSRLAYWPRRDARATPEQRRDRRTPDTRRISLLRSAPSAAARGVAELKASPSTTFIG